MKKHIIYLLPIFFMTLSQAQNGRVGINTEKPQTTLDIAGDVNVSEAIYLNDKASSPGTLNQIITSGGANEAAAWTTKEIALGLDESLMMSSMDSFSDTQGLDFNNSSAGNTQPYNMDELLDPSKGWKELSGLKNDITIYKGENRVNLFFQTMVQFQGDNLASFGCGYFINDNMSNRNQFRLKAVRTDVMLPPTGSFKLFNMNTSIINLAPEAYTIKVACIKRNIGANQSVGIGKALTSALNVDMAQSSLNVIVLEAY
ncbi:MAG TPA: hypothetical protein VL022_09995 [Moheibacter sp.]|nr:hypothetical protein [Moheibacter sp.]